MNYGGEIIEIEDKGVGLFQAFLDKTGLKTSTYLITYAG